MRCVVCEKTIEKGKRTCSMQCAGKLAYSWKKANELRKRFNTKEKNTIREKLCKLIEHQRTSVKNHQTAVLDLWGGGLFADCVLDHRITVKNQPHVVNLYEIDQDPQLFPALRDYAQRMNHHPLMENHTGVVHPFCGSLAKFVQVGSVKNQINPDFIWLDYCGTVLNLRKDIQEVARISSTKTVLALTMMRGRDNMIDAENREKNVDVLIKQYFPYHTRFYTKPYHTDSGNMVFSMYNVPSYKRKALPVLNS